MILTVTLNAAIDKRYVVENFQVGEVNRVKECSYVPGGKGLNVSKPASIYGAEVVATGFVGGHAGNYIEDALKLIKPNIDEIRMLTGKNCDDINDIIEAAKVIHRNGVEIVAVSLGADGSLAVSDEGIFRAEVPKIDAVNTVGCGDSMIAGFAIGLKEGLSLPETLKKASAISAAAAMREETGFFCMEDMEKILPQIKIMKL